VEQRWGSALEKALGLSHFSRAGVGGCRRSRDLAASWARSNPRSCLSAVGGAQPTGTRRYAMKRIVGRPRQLLRARLTSGSLGTSKGNRSTITRRRAGARDVDSPPRSYVVRRARRARARSRRSSTPSVHRRWGCAPGSWIARSSPLSRGPAVPSKPFDGARKHQPHRHRTPSEREHFAMRALRSRARVRSGIYGRLEQRLRGQSNGGGTSASSTSTRAEPRAPKPSARPVERGDREHTVRRLPAIRVGRLATRRRRGARAWNERPRRLPPTPSCARRSERFRRLAA